MGRLTCAESAEFHRIRAVCYQDLDPLELLAVVGGRLRRFIGADAFCANEVDPGTLLLTSAASDGWPIEARPLFLDHVYLRTPAADPGRLLQGGGSTLDVHQVLACRDSPQLDPIFQYHLLPFGYWYNVQLLCAVSGTAYAHFALSRSSTRGAFQDRHMRLLDALAPHIASGLARARLRRALRVTHDGQSGFLVLDDAGRVELANSAAEEWLAAETPANGPLGLELLARQAAWVLLHREDLSLSPFTELRHPLTGALYRIHWEKRADARGQPRVMVLLEPVRRLDQPETLRRMGLTERESQVALAVVRGLATKEIAERLRLSLHTARQHIKSVFAKLGVSSRAELAGLLMGAEKRFSPRGRDPASVTIPQLWDGRRTDSRA